MSVSLTGSDFAQSAVKIAQVFTKNLDNSDSLVDTIYDHSAMIGAGEFLVQVPVLTGADAEIVAEGGVFSDDTSDLDKVTLNIGDEVGGVITFTKASLVGKTEDEIDSMASMLVAAKANSSKTKLNLEVITKLKTTTVTVGDGTTVLTEDLILAAKEELDNAGAPVEGRTLLVSSKDYSRLLKIDAFVDATKLTATQLNQMTSKIEGFVHGFAVKTVTGSTGVTLGSPIAYQSMAVVYASKPTDVLPGAQTNSTKKNLVVSKSFGMEALNTAYAVIIDSI